MAILAFGLYIGFILFIIFAIWFERRMNLAWMASHKPRILKLPDPIPNGRKLALVEPNIQRLDKLEKYFAFHAIEQRYGLCFKEFSRRVEAGTWEAWKADELRFQGSTTTARGLESVL